MFLPPTLTTCLILIFGLAAAVDDSRALYQRRARHTVAVLNDYLYMDGGIMSNYVNGKLSAGYNDTRPVTNTTSISLKSSWNNVDVEKQYIEYKTNNVPNVQISALWVNQKTSELYRWGGEVPGVANSTEGDPVLWAFKADNKGKGSWYKAWADSDRLPAVSGSPTTCGGLHLYFGGGVGASTSSEAAGSTPIRGAFAYNSDDKTWPSYGQTSFPAPYGTSKMGEAICLEGFLNSSLVVYFGGRTVNPETGNTTTPNMSNITLFDAVKHEWYTQETTGAPERGRAEFCAVGAKSKSGTYEIYAYGGDDRGTQGDVCILTLPGFHWICPSELKNGEPRLHHACTLAGKSQMISVGGSRSFSNYNDNDPWANGIGVLDLNSLEWKTAFDTNAAEYDSPQVVKDWYSANQWVLLPSSSRSATLTPHRDIENQVKWASDDIKNMFYEQSMNTQSNDESKGSSTNVGAIAGGVVGGVAGLAFVATVAWWFLRRHQQDNHPINQVERQEPSLAYENYYNRGPSELMSTSTSPGYAKLEQQNELDGTARSELMSTSTPGSFRTSTGNQKHGQRIELP